MNPANLQPHGPLAGIKVLDLSRVLAGPWCSQILGDLGAEVIKVEQPGVGDDTRRWGPPFLDDGSGDSSYYLCANRNKESIAVNMADPEGAAIIRSLSETSDIVLENFRVDGLRKYGLDYDSLSKTKPDIIYCSITGFGQSGPYRNKGGYDFLIQGMSGLMSVTGRPDGEEGEGPLKVGIPIADLSTGLYAAIAILGALYHRSTTGEGQHIDCALLDCQVSLLANQASNWLNGGMVPRRMGNQHPNTVPYQDFRCADQDVLVALGNDRQFRDFCKLIGRSDLCEDPRFLSNGDRSVNRKELLGEMQREIAGWQSADLIEAMEKAGLPGGRVNDIPEALADPQLEARGLIQDLARDNGARVRLLGFPPKMSRTPPTYRTAPPRCGENTREVLQRHLSLSKEELELLVANRVIAD
jgi:crotonobetainyl-CoA:carnitine CoA-transferase CaiB-like acyl-CoA transferase